MFIFASSSSEKRAQIKARRDEHSVDDMNDAVAGNYVSGNNVRIVDGHTVIVDDNLCNSPCAMWSGAGRNVRRQHTLADYRVVGEDTG